MVRRQSFRAKQPPTSQFVNHPIFIMEYNLKNVGKSGIGSVELYRTRLTTAKPGICTPGTMKSRAPPRMARRQESWNCPGEGVYGFILVVKSRAGLGKPAPRPGDIPEIRVEVDTTPPDARLYAPAPIPSIRILCSSDGQPPIKIFR